MSQVCILTDNSAQFPGISFRGYERVNIIPLHLRLNQRLYRRGKGVRVQDLPPYARNGLNPKVLAPSVEEFALMYSRLGRSFGEVVVLLLSSHLNLAYHRALEAAESGSSRALVHVVDSQTTAAGLGMLVQAAAEAAEGGMEGMAIKRMIMGLVPKVYSVFFVSGLTYLHHTGITGSAQALVGEMLGVMPFFVLDGGRLMPIQKARSSRHLVDSLHEYISEFGDLAHIALVQGVPPFEQEVRSLRERIQLEFPGVSLSEHTIGLPVAGMLGPRSLGLFALESQ